MAVQNEQSQGPSGKSESAYPLYALPQALNFAEAVNALGGARSEVDRSMIASQLGIEDKSASLSQRMGAAKSYGMISGRGTYSLTPLGIQYFLPTSESDKQQALLGFLRNPPAFSILIKRFDGSRLPPNPMLGNILQKEANVPGSWKDRVAQIFLNSAKFVGVIDGNGFLRVRSAIQGLQSKVDVAPEQAQMASISDPIAASGSSSSDARALLVPSSSDNSNLWNYSFEGMTVRVETPKDLKLGLWEKLNGYVQLLKPRLD
jgi:hypothetical protein